MPLHFRSTRHKIKYSDSYQLLPLVSTLTCRCGQEGSWWYQQDWNFPLQKYMFTSVPCSPANSGLIRTVCSVEITIYNLQEGAQIPWSPFKEKTEETFGKTDGSDQQAVKQLVFVKENVLREKTESDYVKQNKNSRNNNNYIGKVLRQRLSLLDYT